MLFLLIIAVISNQQQHSTKLQVQFVFKVSSLSF